MRSILFQQPGVLQAEANWRQGRGWVVYDPTQVTAEELAEAVSPYYPSEVVDDQPHTDN